MRKCRDRSVVRYDCRSHNGDHCESTLQLTAMETTTTNSNGDATAVTNASTASAAAAAAPTAGVAVAAAVPMGLERISIPGSIRKKPNPAYVAGRGMQRKAVIVLHEVRAAAGAAGAALRLQRTMGTALTVARACCVLQWWGVTPAVQRQAFEWFGEEFMVVVLVSESDRGSRAACGSQ